MRQTDGTFREQLARVCAVSTMTSKTLRMKPLGTNEGLRRDILLPRDGARRPVARPLAKPAPVREW